MSDSLVLLIAALVLGVIYIGLRRAQRPTRPALDPDKYIVVDGSNVMYWGGEPSVKVLGRVLDALADKGLTPIIYFDANVGYKLWDRYANSYAISKKLNINAQQIFVVERGVVADEVLLKTAVDEGLRVVSNDRFLDWRVQYPKAGEKGFLIKGEWKQGSVMLRGL